jgi:hypothetical protein
VKQSADKRTLLCGPARRFLSEWKERYALIYGGQHRSIVIVFGELTTPRGRIRVHHDAGVCGRALHSDNLKRFSTCLGLDTERAFKPFTKFSGLHGHAEWNDGQQARIVAK